MQEKINKANSIMGIIRRVFTHLDHEIFNKLYKGIVRPHLEYANPVWSPSLRKNIIAIENVQRRATKCIPGMKDLEYKDRLIQLKLPTLVYRRLRGDMIETYKITSEKYDDEIGRILPRYEDIVKRDGIRGHNKKIYKFRSKLNLRKNFFTQRVVDIWNMLPSNVVNAPTTKSFEKRLDKAWKDQDLVYNFEALLQRTTAKTNNMEDQENQMDLEDED